jgi:flavin-dependent dehydrogenase
MIGSGGADGAAGMSLALADPLNSYNVVVLGASVSGLAVASRLRNSSVAVVSASHRPGWPPHCTGLVSPWTAKRLGWEAVRETYDTAVFLKDDFKPFCSIESSMLAVRVSRPLLEELLAEKVQSLGHKILFRRRASRVDAEKGCVHLSGGTRLCAEQAIIVGTGYSSFSKFFGVKKCDKLAGFELRARLLKRLPENVFYTIHGRRFAPDFFAWIVPINYGREALIGLGSLDDPLPRLSELLRAAERRGLLEPDSIISHRGGTIVRGPPAKRVRAGKAWGIGDVLCASKPFTGGGLYAIAVLAPEIARAIYEPSWEPVVQETWRKLRHELLLQRLLTRISLLFREFWRAALSVACINHEGRCKIDYDRHSSLLKCLFAFKQRR